MIKQGLATFLILSCSLQGAEDIEPALGHTLFLGDAKVRLVPGKPEKLPGKFEDPTAKLVPDEFRAFSYGGIRFKYPASYGFEADLSTPGVKFWTLDGNDSVIMIQQYEGIKMSAREFADQLAEGYGESVIGKLKKVSFRFNGKAYSGFRVTASMGGVRIFQDVIGIPTKKGSRIMLIQDHPLEDKVSDEEAKLVSKYLDTTLVVKEL